MFFFLIINKFVRNTKIQKNIDYIFGFISAFFTFFSTNKAIVYSYYLRGFLKFYNIFNLKPEKLICFQDHPENNYINNIIEKDKEKFYKLYKLQLPINPESFYSYKENKEYLKCILSVDSIICASSVTAKSLQVNFKKKINYNIVPYGSKFEKSVPKIFNNKKKENKKIKLLTVCHMSQRKGLHWAFKAMDSLTNKEKNKFEWIIVSEFYDDIILKMAPKNVKFKKKIKIQNLKNLIKKSDLFVLPSLIEGFGHVYLESLSLGTPILYTKNTGPNDFIKNNSSCGFRVNISSAKDISLVFKKIINNSANLKEMKKKTQFINSKINWKNFRKKVANIVIKLDKI